jgi:hypothetical protein
MQKRNYLTILPNHLDLRNKRAQAASVPIPPKDAPLDEDESKAFDIIRDQLIKKSGLQIAEAEQQLQSCIDSYGKKALVNFFIEKPLLNKLALVWLLYLPLGWVVYLILPAYFGVIEFFAGLLVLIGFSYGRRLEKHSRATWEVRRHEKLNAVLTEGIKL